jgi:RNA polymerase sigma factor (sigma-70 family)
LLSLYAERQDAAADEAFRILVERHGPMVLRVCEQVIGDRQDGEDAAQAVFLVLARKASLLRVQGSLAPWLYGVARRVAAKARGRAAARRKLEEQTSVVAALTRDRDRNDSDPKSACDWEVVHDEVGRLPAKYRSPVVLCYLEGQTYEEAARRIGCPVGTIRVRLSRARERLRGRLIRRGLAPEGTTAVGLFAPDAGAILAPATPPTVGATLSGAAWVESTVKAARAFSMGRAAMTGTVSSSVLFFYEGIIRAMMIDWCRTAAVWLAGAGITAAGAFALAAGGPGGQDKTVSSKAQPSAAASAKQAAPPPEVDLDSPDTLRKQTERRVNAAAQRLDAQRAYYEEGRITIDRFINASLELMLAKMAASTTKDERLAAVKAHWDRMADLVKREQSELTIGRGTVADAAEAVLAHENAALAYIEARQSRGSFEVEALKNRVETLEKQLQTVIKQLEQIGAAKR